VVAPRGRGRPRHTGGCGKIGRMNSQMVFRKTNQHLGRRISVTPSNSTNRHLSYGRIRLNGSEPSVAFNSGGQETALICLSGEASVKVGGAAFDLSQYDSIYIPRDSEIEVTTASEVDFAEFSADVDGLYPLQVVRYSDLSKDPSLKFTTGTPGQQRHLNICVGKNVEAGRLLVLDRDTVIALADELGVFILGVAPDAP